MHYTRNWNSRLYSENSDPIPPTTRSLLNIMREKYGCTEARLLLAAWFSAVLFNQKHTQTHTKPSTTNERTTISNKNYTDWWEDDCWWVQLSTLLRQQRQTQNDPFEWSTVFGMKIAKKMEKNGKIESKSQRTWESVRAIARSTQKTNDDSLILVAHLVGSRSSRGE